jgi:predicted small secreted protein
MMFMRTILVVPALLLMISASGCKTASSAVDGVKSAGEAVASGVGSVTTSLVKVDLSNVLNDLALDLNIDKANIPINAQIPISIAANVCGVSINILSIGAGGGSSDGCTANSISPELKQYIQQQLAANGSVGGGAQTTTGATGSTTTPTTTTTPATTTAPTTTSPDSSTPPQS